jgi:hypothetical protein
MEDQYSCLVTFWFLCFLALLLPTRLNCLPRPTSGSDAIPTLVCNCESVFTLVWWLGCFYITQVGYGLPPHTKAWFNTSCFRIPNWLTTLTNITMGAWECRFIKTFLLVWIPSQGTDTNFSWSPSSLRLYIVIITVVVQCVCLDVCVCLQAAWHRTQEKE